MHKLYVITKTYQVPATREMISITDIVGLFKDKDKAEAFWKVHCAGRSGYRFDETVTDII